MYLFFSGCFMAVGVISGCTNKTEKMMSVADYLHDIDAADAELKTVQQHPELSTSQNAINASAASAQVPFLLDCWPKKNGPVSTANTDHACLDAHGYKRD